MGCGAGRGMGLGRMEGVRQKGLTGRGLVCPSTCQPCNIQPLTAPASSVTPVYLSLLLRKGIQVVVEVVVGVVVGVEVEVWVRVWVGVIVAGCGWSVYWL